MDIIDAVMPVKNTSTTRDNLANSLLIIGTAIFVLAFLIMALSSICFIGGYTISKSIFIISFLATITYCLTLSKILLPELRLNQSLYITGTFVLVMAISAVISSAVYDLSWDGQTYHQKAVYYLANNWNPYQEKVSDIWVDHYAKGSWIYAASFYKLVNRIESGKLFNIAFIIGSFIISSAALITNKNIKIINAYILGFIAAFNPVSIYQSLSFYVDGQLSSLLVALSSILYLFASNKNKNIYALLLIPIIIILVNVKFTGLVYSVIIMLTFAVYLFVYSTKKDFYRFLLISVFSLAMAVFIIGYNPYVINNKFYGHPFYPLAGKQAVDIITSNEPRALNNKNQFHKLFISIFSKTGNYDPNSYKSNKIPQQKFSGLEQQFLTYSNTDNRIGGFGVFFGLLFILSIFLTIILLISNIPNKKYFLAAMAILWLTVAANPACWWSRYVPQLWLFPILPAVFALSISPQKVLVILAKVIIFIALINVLTISYFYTQSQLNETQKIRNLISNLSRDNVSVLIGNKDWMATRIRLDENKINYQILSPKKLPCPHPKYFPSSIVPYCINSGNPF